MIKIRIQFYYMWRAMIILTIFELQSYHLLIISIKPQRHSANIDLVLFEMIKTDQLK